MGRIRVGVWCARLTGRIRALRLRPLPAALVGGVGGLAGGGLIALDMVRSATFTGPHQDVTASAVILALWLAIGAIAGLTVLSPEDDA